MHIASIPINIMANSQLEPICNVITRYDARFSSTAIYK